MSYTITNIRQIVAHHRDLAIAYYLAGDVPNHGQHAAFAREFTGLKREI